MCCNSCRCFRKVKFEQNGSGVQLYGLQDCTLLYIFLQLWCSFRGAPAVIQSFVATVMSIPAHVGRWLSELIPMTQVMAHGAKSGLDNS